MYFVIWEDKKIEAIDLMAALDIASELVGSIVVDREGDVVFG